MLKRLAIVKGMLYTCITTRKGAHKNTKVYIVDRFRPDPLLGDGDAQDLGFITFNQEGRDPNMAQSTPSPECTISSVTATDDAQGPSHLSIPQKIRNSLHVEVRTSKPAAIQVPASERTKISSLVEEYKQSVFNKKVGKI